MHLVDIERSDVRNSGVQISFGHYAYSIFSAPSSGGYSAFAQFLLVCIVGLRYPVTRMINKH